jgi:hypothetical protein
VTTLIGWVGVDHRSRASLYLASDSRLSTPGNGLPWDYGQKLFTSSKYPLILGYCGDVFQSNQLIQRIISVIDADYIISEDDSIHTIIKAIENEFSKTPPLNKQDVQILLGYRTGSGMSAEFWAVIYKYSKTNGWRTTILDLPKTSDLIDSLGSGSAIYKSIYSTWKQSDIERTSRSVFSSFCSYLTDCKDGSSSPPPQLVGLYRKGPAILFGIVFQGRRYLAGMETGVGKSHSTVQWRNEYFEVCDALTMKRKEGAQRQPIPSNLVTP